MLHLEPWGRGVDGCGHVILHNPGDNWMSCSAHPRALIIAPAASIVHLRPDLWRWWQTSCFFGLTCILQFVLVPPSFCFSSSLFFLLRFLHLLFKYLSKLSNVDHSKIFKLQTYLRTENNGLPLQAKRCGTDTAGVFISEMNHFLFGMPYFQK